MIKCRINRVIWYLTIQPSGLILPPTTFHVLDPPLSVDKWMTIWNELGYGDWIKGETSWEKNHSPPIHGATTQFLIKKKLCLVLQSRCLPTIPILNQVLGVSKAASPSDLTALVASSSLSSIDNNYGIGWMESVLARDIGANDNTSNPREELERYLNAPHETTCADAVWWWGVSKNGIFNVLTLTKYPIASSRGLPRTFSNGPRLPCNPSFFGLRRAPFLECRTYRDQHQNSIVT
jgi:hypothetical protein